LVRLRLHECLIVIYPTQQSHTGTEKTEVFGVAFCGRSRLPCERLPVRRPSRLDKGPLQEREVERARQAAELAIVSIARSLVKFSHAIERFELVYSDLLSGG
jgi:hypothetical protein